MSIRPVAVDVDPEKGVMLRSDFTLLRRYIGLPRFLFLSLPLTEAHVRYDRVLFLCTIRSGIILAYDTIWKCSRVRYQSQSHTCYDT